jgi:GTP:adenosylcobinamide-phosphate guanylyltransferase
MHQPNPFLAVASVGLVMCGVNVVVSFQEESKLELGTLA